MQSYKEFISEGFGPYLKGPYLTAYQKTRHLVGKEHKGVLKNALLKMSQGADEAETLKSNHFGGGHAAVVERLKKDHNIG